MTAELKARALVQEYFDLTDHLQWNEAIQCADILVGEIIDVLRGGGIGHAYWTQVRTEIEKLKI